MADDRSQSSQPSWRPKSSEESRPKRAEDRWRERRSRHDGAKKAPPSRAFQVACGVAGFLACLATVVFLILKIRPPEPAAVFLVGANYANNLAVPHNVPGWEGLEAIARVSKVRPKWSFFYPAELQLVGEREAALNQLDHKEQWDDLIDNLAKKRITAPTLLIVVALHGGSRADGAYLMPNAIADPDGGLGLRQVIASMAKLPEKQNKILVIEGADVPTAWRLGMIHNDFARKLKELEPEIAKVPNLWVLSGCDVNQRCWASEALGRTILTHYIIEALRGEAGGSDQQLSLDELFQYVRKNVRDWAWNARGALQEPQLLPGPRGGGQGAGTLRTDPKLVNLAASTAAPAPPSVPALDEKSRSDIQGAWREFHRLEAKAPRPTVYSPRRWREYRATLVRYEELLRAGAASLAKELRDKRLVLLEGNLKDERFLKKSLVSGQLNLAMNVLQGGAVEPMAQSADFDNFLKASPAKAAGEWEALRSRLTTSSIVDHPRSPRSRVEDLLIQYAAGELRNGNSNDLAANLKNAAYRLKTIKGSQPFSAEAHFLRMLDTHLDPSALKEKAQLWNAVKAALVVRRRAERAAMVAAFTAGDSYHYSEQVHPWIRASIATADEKRRRGEDLLFSSVESDWQEAGRVLDRAKRDYDQAILTIGKVRSALEIRDRALAGLPDYSRWLPFYEDANATPPTDPRPTGEANTGRKPATDFSQKTTVDLTALTVDLWEKTHQLSDLLETDNFGDQSRLADIQKRADELKKNFLVLEEQFQRHVGKLESTRSEQDWESAVAAAAVAFPDNDSLKLRNDILVRLDNIREADIAVAKTITERKSKILEPDERQADLALQGSRRRASLQATIALAVLGDHAFKAPTDTAKDGGEDQFQVATDHVRKLRSANGSESWWEDAQVVGEMIGQRWRQMSAELGEAKRITEYATLQSRLVRLDRLARRIDAGGEPSSDEPDWTTRLRETRVSDVLRWLADRTWEDHWFNEDPNERPTYYQSAVLNLLSDSADLLAAFPDIRPPKKEFDFKGQLALELINRDSIVLTSEKNASASYRVVEKGGMPKQGIPVVKPLAGPGLTLDVPGGIAEYRTASRQAEGPSIDFKFFSPLLRDAEQNQGKTDSDFTRPQVKRSKLTVSGFFRGQVFPIETPVELHPVADVVAIGPPPADPPDAGVAVKANGDVISKFGQGTGSIAIVLDCSGSMKYNRDNTENDKLKNAKIAITRVLQDVPQGTTVSLWTFSQLPADIATNVNGVPINGGDPRFKQLEAEPELTIQCLREPSRWDPNQINGLRTQLDGLRPWFATPLVEAMVTAAKKDLINAKGMKTLLVLTDGDDTRFAQSRALAPYRVTWPDIPSFISSYFKTLGITINMVFLCTNEKDPEIQQARTNFAKSLEGLTPPGTFVSATDAQLIQSLRRALRQKLIYDIVKSDGTLVQQTLDVSGEQPDDPLVWSSALKAGTYRLRVHANRTYEQRIELQRGDRLIVQLVDDQHDGIAFERGMFGDEEEFRASPQRKLKDWRLAALEHQTLGEAPNTRLLLLTSLEPNTSPTGAPLRQVKPRLTWFDLNVAGDRSPTAYSLRWHERIKYPAPAWLIEVPRWIKDRGTDQPAKPILGAWWSEPNADLPSLTVPLGNAVAFQNSLPKSINGEGDTVTVEGLDIEDHLVEVRPGGTLQQESCLVIRLGFPKDNPYIVDPTGLAGLDPAGYEHRLYSQANKYTGLFWPVTRGELSQLKGLNLISIARFQRQAKALDTAVSELKLPAPKTEAADKTPRPIDLQP